MSNETPGYLAELLAEVLGYVLDLAVWIGGPYAVFVFWGFLCALFAFCILLPFGNYSGKLSTARPARAI